MSLNLDFRVCLQATVLSGSLVDAALNTNVQTVSLALTADLVAPDVNLTYNANTTDSLSSVDVVVTFRYTTHSTALGISQLNACSVTVHTTITDTRTRMYHHSESVFGFEVTDLSIGHDPTLPSPQAILTSGVDGDDQYTVTVDFFAVCLVT